MNDMVATEAEDNPWIVTSEKARRNDRDQGRRTSSGPAANAPRQKAGKMTAADQAATTPKTARQPGPSTYGRS